MKKEVVLTVFPLRSARKEICFWSKEAVISNAILKLAKDKNKLSLFQPKTKLDLGNKMNHFSDNLGHKIKGYHIDNVFSLSIKANWNIQKSLALKSGSQTVNHQSLIAESIGRHGHLHLRSIGAWIKIGVFT